MKPLINIFNATTSKTVGDQADLEKVIAALQIQVTRDFFPIWGFDAILNSAVDQHGAWGIGIFDNSDQADALEYHELTSEGLPLVKVFAETNLRAGTSLTATLSHGLLEMLADPWVNECVEFPMPNGRDSQFYAKEIADACESDEYGYKIGDVLVSDFVTPAWFVPGGWPNIPYDLRGHITQPFQLLPGGYISVYDHGTGWGQIILAASQQQIATHSMIPVGSRRWKRLHWPKTHWRRSVPKK